LDVEVSRPGPGISRTIQKPTPIAEVDIAIDVATHLQAGAEESGERPAQPAVAGRAVATAAASVAGVQPRASTDSGGSGGGLDTARRIQSAAEV
jgi:hypothetical protein